MANMETKANSWYYEEEEEEKKERAEGKVSCSLALRQSSSRSKEHASMFLVKIQQTESKIINTFLAVLS